MEVEVGKVLRTIGATGMVSLALLSAAASSPDNAAAGVLTCAQSPERVFAPWGDHSPYTLAPNGNFESGASGWALSGGASVVGGNNTFRAGVRSLALPAGASATSPQACVRLADDAARFFVRNTGSATGSLKVEVIYRTVLGLIPLTETLGYVTTNGTWKPSPKYRYLANLVGVLSLDNGLGTHVRFRFTARGLGARFQIDDLFVDPLITV
jgi:hypothetical protein